MQEPLIAGPARGVLQLGAGVSGSARVRSARGSTPRSQEGGPATQSASQPAPANHQTAAPPRTSSAPGKEQEQIDTPLPLVVTARSGRQNVFVLDPNHMTLSAIGIDPLTKKLTQWDSRDISADFPFDGAEPFAKQLAASMLPSAPAPDTRPAPQLPVLALPVEFDDTKPPACPRRLHELWDFLGATTWNRPSAHVAAAYLVLYGEPGCPRQLPPSLEGLPNEQLVLLRIALQYGRDGFAQRALDSARRLAHRSPIAAKVGTWFLTDRRDSLMAQAAEDAIRNRKNIQLAIQALVSQLQGYRANHTSSDQRFLASLAPDEGGGRYPDKSPEGRTKAIDLLGKIGPPAKAALPVLQEIVRTEENLMVAVSAEQAIKKIGANDQSPGEDQ